MLLLSWRLVVVAKFVRCEALISARLSELCSGFNEGHMGICVMDECALEEM